MVAAVRTSIVSPRWANLGADGQTTDTRMIKCVKSNSENECAANQQGPKPTAFKSTQARQAATPTSQETPYLGEDEFRPANGKSHRGQKHHWPRTAKDQVSRDATSTTNRTTIRSAPRDFLRDRDSFDMACFPAV